MAGETVLVDGKVSSVNATPEKFYTASTQTFITSFTATNITESNKFYRVYIYDKFDSTFGPTEPRTIVVRDRFDRGTALIGHIIPEGGSLWLETDIAGGILFRVTGKQV